MYDDLKDKRVVVTGGASGIGFATARRFIKEGSRVAILDCNQEMLNKALDPGWCWIGQNPGCCFNDVSQHDKAGFLSLGLGSRVSEVVDI